MKIVPILAPVIAPKGLNACEKFNLRSDDDGSPSPAINGLAPVSRKESPDAITKRATRKAKYFDMSAAGRNKRQPKE